MPHRENRFSFGLTGTDRYYGWALYALWAVCLIGWAAVFLVREDFTVEARILQASSPAHSPVNRAVLIQWAKRMEPSPDGQQQERTQERLSAGLKVYAASGGALVLQLRDPDPRWAQNALSVLLEVLAEPKPGSDAAASAGLMVLAQPSVTERPSLPARSILSALVLVFAVFIAAAVVIGSALARPAVRSSGELAALTGLPVLGEVPLVWENAVVRQQLRQRNRRLLLGLAGLGAVFLLIAALEMLAAGTAPAHVP